MVARAARVSFSHYTLIIFANWENIVFRLILGSLFKSKKPSFPPKRKQEKATLKAVFF